MMHSITSRHHTGFSAEVSSGQAAIRLHCLWGRYWHLQASHGLKKGLSSAQNFQGGNRDELLRAALCLKHPLPTQIIIK